MRTWIMVLVLAVVLVGCAGQHTDLETAQAAVCSGQDVSGFWWGLWNGLVAVLALIGRYVFGMDIAVYEVCNSGGWYWFGFVLGVGFSASTSFSGGSSAAARHQGK